MKTCSHCGEEKPADQFRWYTFAPGKKRQRGQCIPCKRKLDREYTNGQRDLKRQMESNKNWRDNNREYFKAWARAHYHEQNGNPVPFVKRRPWAITRPK